MAEQWWRGNYPPYEIGSRLALLLDLALVSGRSPLRLLDGDHPDTWTELDLEILAQYRNIKEAKCPGCGRPLSQHLHNSTLGREETPEDYMAWSLDCPARQAIADGQHMWRTENKSSLDAHMRGNGPDPGDGLYWLAQGDGESLPQPIEIPHP